MGEDSKIGRCLLCGEHGPLTFEHVPPRAAFNKYPLVLAHGDEILKRLGDLDTPIGRTKQGGVGGYTLCGKCNNSTGRWYGREFVSWARQGLGYLVATRLRPSVLLPFHIRPLPVIKQIVSMFFSAHGEGLRQECPDLVRFVLDPKRCHMHPDYRIFAYFHVSARMRQSGRSVIGHLASGRVWRVSEIAFPPIGYVMTHQAPCPDSRLVEISHFATYAYDAHRTVWLRLPPLEIYTPYPCDFRSRDEVLRTTQENRARYGAGSAGAPAD